MSWTTIRDAVETRLDTITGLNGKSLAPQAEITNDGATVTAGDPLFAEGGHSNRLTVNFNVNVWARRMTLEEAQTAMDGYIWPSGTNSIIAAIYATPTLGGTVDGVRFVEAVAYEADVQKNAVQVELHFTAGVTA